MADEIPKNTVQQPPITSMRGRGRPSASGMARRPSEQTPTKGIPVEVFDSMEKESEAMVNKLQREINALRSDRSRSRSHSASSTSSSISRNTSMRSMKTEYEAPSTPGSNSGSTRGSFSGEGNDQVVSLRRENEVLKKKLADLSIRCEYLNVYRNNLRSSISTLMKLQCFSPAMKYG